MSHNTKYRNSVVAGWLYCSLQYASKACLITIHHSDLIFGAQWPKQYEIILLKRFFVLDINLLVVECYSPGNEFRY